MTPSKMAVNAISQRNFSAGILWTMNAAMGDERATPIDMARVRLTSIGALDKTNVKNPTMDANNSEND